MIYALVDKMNSYREIENLVYRYAENVDLGDFEAGAEMFSGGVITGSPGRWRREGYSEVLEMNRTLVRVYDDTGTPCTKTIVSNLIIELGQDQLTATARSCFTVMQGLPDFPLQAIIAGRYFDKFVLRRNQWHFKKRRILPEYYGDLSRHLLFAVDTITAVGGSLESPESLRMFPGIV